MTHTITLRDGRKARLVPADAAGEFYAQVDADPAVMWREAGFITVRQCEALMQLTRLYALGGGMTAWRRGTRGATEKDEEAVAAARREHQRLTACAPTRDAWALLPACQGEWPVGRGMPEALTRALDAVAAALKLPGELEHEKER